MYFIIGIVAVVIFVSCLYFSFEVKLSPKHILTEAAYQLYYYILGSTAMVEDYIYRGRNNTEVVHRPGDVAVITGGARGLGVETVKHLLRCSMHVVIGCRNVEAGQKTIAKIRTEGITSGSADCLPLDVASLQSVKDFAASVLSKYPEISLLINNAGIMFVPYKLTVDGYESHFAVNYLGHCLLTHLLLSRLKESGQIKGKNSRIVNVSSCAHMAGAINFKDLTMKKLYIPSASYAQSKLAQILFTYSLDSLMKSESAAVQVHSVHPGIVDTDIFNGTLLKTVAPWAPALFFKTPAEGAASVLYACLSENLEGQGGSYISNCQVTGTSSNANCKETQDKLWNTMLTMLKVETFGINGE